MVFDYKKQYKQFYLPTTQPVLIDIPSMNFVAVRGQGNPNDAGGTYQTAVELLYTVSYTLKMSYKTNHPIEGFYEYVVPPLEGFWWQTTTSEVDYTAKDKFNWISLIRLPDFVSQTDFAWAIEVASHKKPLDFSLVEFLTYQEGLCVQCLHVGSFDNETTTLQAMEQLAMAQGYVTDITPTRFHHEIYLTDPRKTSLAKLKTVLRHPVKLL